MKKIYIILLLSLLMLLPSCINIPTVEFESKVKKTNEFEYAIEQGTVSIGNILTEKKAVFIPYFVENKKVTKLGFDVFMNEITMGSVTKVERVYLPNSIEEFFTYVMQRNKKVFYCGNPIDLYHLCYGVEGYPIFVPYETYDEFNDLFIYGSEDNNLIKANVTYYLNYPDKIYEYNEYYYIDYYDNGSLIEFIPPNPEKEGYTFDGWYKEPECINQWDFTKNLTFNVEESPVTNLYAKWVTI